MAILVYKRTHSGDPDHAGCFGVHDCMGSIRDRNFDAVIGVGGIGEEAQAHRIDGKINWIGIGPQKVKVKGKRGAEVTFDHFLYYGTRGPDFRSVAPNLAGRIYRDNVRILLHGFTATELSEARAIVRRASNSPPSSRTVRAMTSGQLRCGCRAKNKPTSSMGSSCG